MSEGEWAELVEVIRGYWPNSRFPAEAAAIWYRKLKYWSAIEVERVLDAFHDSEERMPSWKVLKARLGPRDAWAPEPCHQCWQGYVEIDIEPDPIYAGTPGRDKREWKAWTFCSCPLGRRRDVALEEWERKYRPASVTT